MKRDESQILKEIEELRVIRKNFTKAIFEEKDKITTLTNQLEFAKRMLNSYEKSYEDYQAKIKALWIEIDELPSELQL